MSVTPEPVSPNKPSLKQITHIIYGLMALGVLSFGFFSVATIAAVVIAYIKRGDASGTVYAAHFDWLLATFWWSLLWLALSALGTLLFIGWVTGLIVVIWMVYRIAKGWLALLELRSPRS